jgi:hypothetical protein
MYLATACFILLYFIIALVCYVRQVILIVIIDLLQARGAVLVMIVWWLDLQLPMQSVHITTNFVSSNPSHGEIYLNNIM